MGKMYIRKLSLIALIIMFLSGCSSTTTTTEGEDRLEFKEDATINISSVIYNEERNFYNVEYKSNLDYELEFTAILYDTDNQVIGKRENIIVEESINGYGYREFEIIPSNNSFKNLKNVKVYLELIIAVDNSKNINTALIGNYDKGGGFYDEVIEQYQDSEYVKITPASPETFDEYTMTIKSDPYTIEEHILVDSTENTGEVQTAQYSTEFIDYNKRYYEQFRNQLDLISSNFEILAMDGYGNENIIEDLITWTSEFNGLLEVYETDSAPLNELDQELHDHTAAMIIEQRSVNENIIKGLTEYDESYFLIAGDYLKNVTDMYLEGDDLLSY